MIPVLPFALIYEKSAGNISNLEKKVQLFFVAVILDYMSYFRKSLRIGKMDITLHNPIQQAGMLQICYYE